MKCRHLLETLIGARQFFSFAEYAGMRRTGMCHANASTHIERAAVFDVLKGSITDRTHPEMMSSIS